MLSLLWELEWGWRGRVGKGVCDRMDGTIGRVRVPVWDVRKEGESMGLVVLL